MKFCTYHDSHTVLACAKFRRDWNSFSSTITIKMHCAGNSIKLLLVRRTPGFVSHLSSGQHIQAKYKYNLYHWKSIFKMICRALAMLLYTVLFIKRCQQLETLWGFENPSISTSSFHGAAQPWIISWESRCQSNFGDHPLCHYYGDYPDLGI